MEESKFKILETVYNGLHESRRSTETLQNRVAFSFGTLLLVFAGLVLKGDYQVEGKERVAALTFIIGITLLASRFLFKTQELVLRNCRMTVRIEQIMGLYTEGLYISCEVVASFGGKPHQEATVFPPEVLQWGDRWQFLNSHLSVVLCSGAGACFALLMSSP